MEKQRESQYCCSENRTDDVRQTQDEAKSQSKNHEDASGPMATGMNMAKKMMSQMGHGGSPFEMMQKMMSQMGHGEGKPPMEKMMGMCMGMCSEMLNAIRQTNALAVHATPELQKIFSDWMKRLEAKAVEIVAKGESDSATLAAALDVSEDTANYILGRLAAAGKVTLAAKAKAA